MCSRRIWRLRSSVPAARSTARTSIPSGLRKAATGAQATRTGRGPRRRRRPRPGGADVGRGLAAEARREPGRPGQPGGEEDEDAEGERRAGDAWRAARWRSPRRFEGGLPASAWRARRPRSGRRASAAAGRAPGDDEADPDRAQGLAPARAARARSPARRGSAPAASARSAGGAAASRPSGRLRVRRSG